ncbi:conserved hypothetical protein [Cupriavidus phytorum]|uniref:Uncharacterized protein n=5 Tax=Burkholderiaceae TaxID=119060 RepID=A0A375HX91_9BURK|nr:conserved hypothetical protein [Cupriavidus taiwanensis]SPD62547.1 conserved protein of unknown function [Cupriavidus neocaledonicus]SOZ00573.1 conserved hypothetical protein [Cupriavidus taiwanensis]SOZ21642.1 conserved hypothetical protein [Cupriavidus taiwanensis]SOZ76533.1 conserved hypothetical protein [Cupriavidus taiwanensis]
MLSLCRRSASIIKRSLNSSTIPSDTPEGRNARPYMIGVLLTYITLRTQRSVLSGGLKMFEAESMIFSFVIEINSIVGFQLPTKHQYVQVVEHEPAPASVGETAITRSTLPAMVGILLGWKLVGRIHRLYPERAW